MPRSRCISNSRCPYPVVRRGPRLWVFVQLVSSAITARNAPSRPGSHALRLCRHRFPRRRLPTLIDSGWEPVKLFTRPCDNVYDFNDVTVARARALRLPIQMSRIRPPISPTLAASRCEALVVAGYPWLVKGWEGHLPYALNFHPSPLPEGRGPYPLFQAILEGAPAWGMSVHALTPPSTPGPVVAQDRFAARSRRDTRHAPGQVPDGGEAASAASLATDLPGLWSERRAAGTRARTGRASRSASAPSTSRGTSRTCCARCAPSGPSRPWRMWAASGFTFGGGRLDGIPPATPRARSSTATAATRGRGPRRLRTAHRLELPRWRPRARARPGGLEHERHVTGGRSGWSTGEMRAQ